MSQTWHTFLVSLLHSFDGDFFQRYRSHGAALFPTWSNLRRNLSDCLHHIHSLNDLSPDRVAAIEEVFGAERNKELATVGVRTCIRHAQAAFTIELQLRRDLVLK